MGRKAADSQWKRYPSMTALRMLDAIAKLGNMQAASGALNVTPSAVSHQLRHLEEMLGVKLVHRAGRRTELTSAGNRYLHEVRKALELIEAAAHPPDAEPRGNLRINCPSGFGTYWLAREIGEFSALYPNITLEITSDSGQVDVLTKQADLAIQYGDGAWPGLAVQHLSTPRTFPVCSPKLIERLGQIRSPDDLKNAPLLHHNTTSDWVIWLAAATQNTIEVQRGTTFSDMTQLISATMAGSGVAISDSLLAEQALDDGKLIRLFETEVPAQQAYYLVAEKDRLERGVTRIAAEWLTRKFHEYAAPDPL
ncbi:LysR substrate-binding domain-containing protein [Ruegeria meonggei]|uniref:Glycine cleavage system transcriptional activator n=1 Tax=Ruegeria meonggei TaxID=1446476 RepID=A0A1X7A182_9RHOB|nr:LysR substrate-binding domain-containing protein [Ruegeria meonggei]SLN67384.1 Glycine cleavage system transcriptional activator [Ruegeria meonggei]